MRAPRRRRRRPTPQTQRIIADAVVLVLIKSDEDTVAHAAFKHVVNQYFLPNLDKRNGSIARKGFRWLGALACCEHCAQRDELQASLRSKTAHREEEGRKRGWCQRSEESRFFPERIVRIIRDTWGGSHVFAKKKQRPYNRIPTRREGEGGGHTVAVEGAMLVETMHPSRRDRIALQCWRRFARM